MTESQDALIAAIRAEEKAQAAHLRLDRMNGSIDRLSREVTTSRSEIGTKVDGVLLHLAQTSGFEQAKRQWKASTHYWLNVIVAAVAAGATVLGLKFF